MIQRGLKNFNGLKPLPHLYFSCLLYMAINNILNVPTTYTNNKVFRCLQKLG